MVMKNGFSLAPGYYGVAALFIVFVPWAVSKWAVCCKPQYVFVAFCNKNRIRTEEHFFDVFGRFFICCEGDCCVADDRVPNRANLMCVFGGGGAYQHGVTLRVAAYVSSPGHSAAIVSGAVAEVTRGLP